MKLCVLNILALWPSPIFCDKVGFSPNRKQVKSPGLAYFYSLGGRTCSRGCRPVLVILCSEWQRIMILLSALGT